MDNQGLSTAELKQRLRTKFRRLRRASLDPGVASARMQRLPLALDELDGFLAERIGAGARIDAGSAALSATEAGDGTMAHANIRTAQRTAAAFVSSPDEPDTTGLLAWLAAHGWRIITPAMHYAQPLPDGGIPNDTAPTRNGKLLTIEWQCITADCPQPDATQRTLLHTPMHNSAVVARHADAASDERPVELLGAEELEKATVIFVPAVAVDRNGVRLGHGAGWYDRALRHRTPGSVLIAVVWPWEITDSLPCDRYDVRMDAALTSQGITCFMPFERNARHLSARSLG